MYVMTREKTNEDVVNEVYITSPRFNIDDIRRVKAAIRFNIDKVEIKDCESGISYNIGTIMKYGRCVSVSMISGALYQMKIRLAGKENDSVYVISPIYNGNKFDITVEKAYTINKDDIVV